MKFSIVFLGLLVVALQAGEPPTRHRSGSSLERIRNENTPKFADVKDFGRILTSKSSPKSPRQNPLLGKLQGTRPNLGN